MSSVLDILRKSTEFLKLKGIENARANAEWLLSSVLRCRRLDLYLRYDSLLSGKDLEAFRQLIRRKIRHEPLQYILGYVDFCDLRLNVNTDVLIPRPETEELVYKIQEQHLTVHRFLDLGTGSGALALALAKNFPKAEGMATDASSAALNCAQKNASMNQVSTIKFIQSHWFEKVDGIFDLIVSNPPYLSEKEWEETKAEVHDFEPKAALTSPEEGLKDLKEILEKAQKFLTPQGHLFLEMGYLQGEFLKTFAQSLNYNSPQILTDFRRNQRFLWLQKGLG